RTGQVRLDEMKVSRDSVRERHIPPRIPRIVPAHPRSHCMQVRAIGHSWCGSMERPMEQSYVARPRTPCRTRRSKCARSWYKASVVTTTTMAARDVETDGGEPRPRPYLFYVLDAQRPLGSAARYALDRFERVVFGRGATPSVRSLQGDLCIGLVDPYVSTTHAVVERDRDGRFLLEDRSKNGTFLNGTPSKGAVLEDGDLIEIG